LLFEKFYNAIIKIKIDYTFAYKICDIIDIARRWRRAIKSRKDCEKTKYLTIIKIEVIKKESAAADKIKRKKKKKYWALYGKRKLTQFI
jgi:hypothetical protein